MIETKRLNIVEAKIDDIGIIMEMERHDENRDYVWQGTYEQHKNEIESDDFYLFTIREKVCDKIVGFALINIDNQSEKFELRRIAISKKGIGYGKEVMLALLRFAFEELNMNRFWLDVYPDNERGIKLYESVGMLREGVLRQNYKSERGYLDQVVYSMLKKEYYEKVSSREV